MVCRRVSSPSRNLYQGRGAYSISSAEFSKKLMIVPSSVMNIDTCSTETRRPFDDKLEYFSMYLWFR